MEASAREMLLNVSRASEPYGSVCTRNALKRFAVLACETFSDILLLLLTLSPDRPNLLDRQQCPSPRRSSLVMPWNMRSRLCRGMPRVTQPAGACSACTRAATKLRLARMGASGRGRPKSRCSLHRSTRTSTAAITNPSTPNHGRSTRTYRKPTRSSTFRARSSRLIRCIGT